MSHRLTKAQLQERYYALKEEIHRLNDVSTLKVYAALAGAGLDANQAHKAVDAMQKAGILFRERTKSDGIREGREGPHAG